MLFDHTHLPPAQGSGAAGRAGQLHGLAEGTSQDISSGALPKLGAVPAAPTSAAELQGGGVATAQS